MSRILQSVIKRMLCTAVAVLILAAFFSCSEDLTTAVPTECIVTIEVTGVTATVDVVYYDQADNPMITLFTDLGAVVPYSRQITETIDYADIQNRQVSVTADVDVVETLSLNVYYEEIYDHPPDNNRRIIAHDNYENPSATPVNAHTLNVNFILPVQ
ncbi:hypothetical protein [Marispirochaeta sp.]|jgi:hypothetical protein|uniref:hypothetical protein n=1 Tax=Marispirochaeta sp. TaxID=2038653 RepID=UPI0029C80BF9|nr:hypothetical protein [Marispirochaeta sp.]